MKPTAYIETTIIGYLTSRLSRDLITAAHQLFTQNWWYKKLVQAIRRRVKRDLMYFRIFHSSYLMKIVATWPECCSTNMLYQQRLWRMLCTLLYLPCMVWIICSLGIALILLMLVCGKQSRAFVVPLGMIHQSFVLLKN